MDTNITTFKQLYEFLQEYDGNIIEWLKIQWEGKDKQESLLRLFSGLNLITKINNYKICKGNFNLKTIEPHISIKDIFINHKNRLIRLKDKGDSSDLTGININNNKNILVTTSKNYNKNNIGKLDIDKILTNFEQYKNEYTMTLCICIRKLKDYNIMINNIEKTNIILKNIIKKNTIIIEWKDLEEGFLNFKNNFKNTTFDMIKNSNKQVLLLKLHQLYSVRQTINLKNNKETKILWGHIQRSGKSYIIGGTIIKDSYNKDNCNYLIITTAPNETIEQYLKVLDCIQLQEFNIIYLNGENIKPNLTNRNIIICSKQFLQTKIEKKDEEKTKSIIWLKKMIFDIRFLDESHNGGTTVLAQKTLQFYGNNVFTIQITATYNKPINDYNIKKENMILWDLEDIKLCKTIDNEDNFNKLVKKHGIEFKNVLNNYTISNIINEYSKYPSLELLTWDINDDTKNILIERNKNSNQGWSLEGVFLGNWDLKTLSKDEILTFQNKIEVIKIFNNIFGEYDEFGIKDDKYPINNIFMNKIKDICLENNSRHIDDNNEPMIIMCFLPQMNIYNISLCLKELLETEHLLFNPDNGEYIIVNINSRETGNEKDNIKNAWIQAKNSKKKGVLVFSGKQASLGISIDNCDIVILLNNNMSFDMTYQMMFRGMTEASNKKCGFVIDLNIDRVIKKTLMEYSLLINPTLHPKDGIKFILKERLIGLNSTHWKHNYGNNEEKKLEELTNKIYEIYSADTINALKHFLDRLKFKEIILTNDENKIFYSMFNNGKINKQQQKVIEDLTKENKIKKGIEKIVIDTENSNSNDEVIQEDKKQNYMDILKHIIPLICLLTIHNTDTSFIEMFKFIEDNKYIYEILITQTQGWWGNEIDDNIFKNFINIYIKYIKDDIETNQIIRTVKELFMKNINNNNELSSLIDVYLIPQELEKKKNAEVSTPYKLRNEMLDKIPIDFWKIPNKVFEPCVGKGGFLIDIIDRFMKYVD